MEAIDNEKKESRRQNVYFIAWIKADERKRTSKPRIQFLYKIVVKLAK